jgi:3-hydroxyacyl-CoA dehydrogenase
MKVEDIKMVAVIDAGDMGHGIEKAALITGI